MSIYRRGLVPVLHRFDLEKVLKEQGFENWEKISRFLCEGTTEGYYDSDLTDAQYAYQVVDNTKWRGTRDAKFWQRLNRLWFFPLYLLSVPFQWLFRGRIGFESTSKFAELISKITGLR